MDHFELKKSLWTNWEEANGTAGFDDDRNGFVDDIHGFDFYGDDGDPEHGPAETYYHGTHVGGIAAAKTYNNEGIGVAGVAGGWGPTRATGCKLMILRFMHADTLRFSLVDDAIDYAVSNGADVVCMSFHAFEDILGLPQAADYAWSNGTFLVASVANDADRIYQPASIDKISAVGATDHNDNWLSYSTAGSQVNLVAPGGNWGIGVNIDRPRILSSIGPGSTQIGYKHGTSMSTPMVAGAVALARSADPDLTNAQIWSVLEFSVDDEAGTASEGWEDTYGWGRLNVATMLEAIDYLPNSSYTYSDSLCKVFCPGADADSFVITVTIKDGQNNAVEDLPASAIWVESLYWPFKVCCADEESPRCYMSYSERAFADGPTDSFGVTTITFKRGGGYYNVLPMRKVRVYGLDLPASGVPWSLPAFRSFDITRDCVVDGDDLQAFYRMRLKQNLAADFDCDDDVDAADSLLLVGHYGHGCPRSHAGPAHPQDLEGLSTLRQNNPNPFNPETRIAYRIAADGAHTRVAVYNLAGRRIRILVDGAKTAGDHIVTWDGRDESGRVVPSGVYFYRIEVAGFSRQMKMVLLK
jgi:hypothetical protein